MLVGSTATAQVLVADRAALFPTFVCLFVRPIPFSMAWACVYGKASSYIRDSAVTREENMARRYK